MTPSTRGMLKGSLRSVCSSRALWKLALNSLWPSVSSRCFCENNLLQQLAWSYGWKAEKMKSPAKSSWDNDCINSWQWRQFEIVGQILISKKKGKLASLLRIHEEIAGKLLPPSGDARFGYAESDALDFEDSMANPGTNDYSRITTMNCTSTFCWRYFFDEELRQVLALNIKQPKQKSSGSVVAKTYAATEVTEVTEVISSSWAHSGCIGKHWGLGGLGVMLGAKILVGIKFCWQFLGRFGRILDSTRQPISQHHCTSVAFHTMSKSKVCFRLGRSPL